jgi:acetate kinase
MEWCGLALDPERNAHVLDVPSGQAIQISRDDAPLAVYVVAVDEETQMVRETVRCLRNTV